MLVDAVIFNDELDLLRLRFTLLAEDVDHFVVAESARTFSGRPKPLHLTENLATFADVADRLTVVQYAAPEPVSVRWEREAAARNALRRAVVGLAPDGVVLLCDVDEIPSAEQCRAAREVQDVRVVPLTTYFRRANWKVEYDSPLLVTRVAAVSALPDDLEVLRHDMSSDLARVAGESGAHLSYMGFGPEELAAKYASFSHDELDFPAASSTVLVRLADEMAVDHLGRTTMAGR